MDSNGKTKKICCLPLKNQDLVHVQNLVKYFPVKGGVFKQVKSWVKAVDGVSFSIKQGQTLGLVGESGCGKTTVSRTALRLIPATSGDVYFDGKDVLNASKRDLKDLRRQMQIIFQDPHSSLDSRLKVGESIGMGLYIHGMRDKRQRQDVVSEMLHKVGLDTNHADRYPYEFSGGQLQRIGIARVLALNARFVVCDEPVSALDVSIQSQILNLLKSLQDEMSLTFLFVAHNMSVVEHMSDQIAVMYLGKLVELASREELFKHPKHPYTQALMSAIPVSHPRQKKNRIILTGDVPSPLDPPDGCRFHPRCSHVMDHCRVEEPELKQIAPGHQAKCWLY
jgi:oligopeptide/dipeptide ABC transporter ATP-binding protein